MKIRTIIFLALVLILLALSFRVHHRFLFLIVLLTWFYPWNREKRDEKYKAYYRTDFLSNFNPFTIIQSFQQLLGQYWGATRYNGDLPEVSTYESKVVYHLPFRGEWLAANGGTTIENSHSWEIYGQRYAYDFIQQNREGKSYDEDGKTLSDYYCFGAEVLAVADGQVVQVSNGITDYPKVGDYSIDWKTRDFRGNFVIIRHAKGEYSFTAHFKRGSICVKTGERVTQGQVIGLVGNSGHSTEPHIHFHLQDRPSFWTGIGLPIKFYDYNIVEQKEMRPIAQGYLEKDQIIASN